MIKRLRFLLAALCLLVGTGALAQGWETGNYYLKNNASGRFLGAANAWGTQASLVEHPEYVTLHKQDDGTYQLESRVNNGGTQYYFTGSFMDGNNPVNLTFTPVEGTKFYTMSNGTAYYGWDGTSTVLASNLSATDENAQWEVVSEADMKASLSAATPSAPMDATFFIKDHSFSRNNRDAGVWTKVNVTSGGPDSDKCLEAWHKTFSITQNLAELPVGVYALSAQAFYRQEGSDNTNLPVIFANDATSQFPERTGTENSMGEASTSFTAGKYKVPPVFVRVEDGNLTIGAKLEVNATLWSIWDHFSLTYYGDCTVNEAKFAGFTAQINTLKVEATPYATNVSVSAAVKAQVSSAITAAENELSNASATETSLQTVIDALNTAISAAQSCIPAYEWLARELATASSLGADVAEQQAGYDNGTYDVEGATAAAQAVNVATYNQVKSNYPYPYTLDEWTGEIGTASGQHWSGDGRSYYDTNGTNITRSLTNTVTLPAGDYVLKAAGRSSAAATMELDINGTKVTFTAKGDHGYGIDTDGNANFSSTGTYANDGAGRGWEWQHLRLTLTEETTLTLKATITTTGWAWGSFTDITLQMDEATCVSLNYPKLGELLEDCKPWVNKGEYATTIYPAYQTAYNNKTYTTFEAINNAMTDLKAAYDAYVPFANAYDLIALYENISLNSTPNAASFKTTFDEAIAAAKSAVDAATTSDAIAAAVEPLEPARQIYVQNAYPINGCIFDMTFNMANPDISGGHGTGWTKTGDALTSNSGQHWSGNTNLYIEPCDWGSTGWDGAFEQTVTIPNGVYTLKAAVRGSTNAIYKLVAGDIELILPSTTAAGGTIATDGTEWESIEAGKAAGKSFANSGNGFGWVYASIENVKVFDGKVKIGGNATSEGLHEWCSYDDFQLMLTRALTDEEILANAVAVLNEDILTAKAIDITTNVGDAVFQIPTSAATALTTAIQKAEGIAATSGLALDAYETAATDLNAAVEAFKATALNAPAADEAFRLVLRYEGWTYDNRAVSFRKNRTDGQGDWNIGYWFAADANYLQAINFVATSNPNEYKMRIVDTEGQVRYVCTGEPYGKGTASIRTTTDEAQALAVKVIATGKAGIYNLRNTVANEYIGSQDAGFYTVNSHIDFSIESCAKAEVTLNITEAEYATITLPFAAELPEGVEAYSCADAAEADAAGYRTLTLTAAEKFEANVPYIVKGAAGTTATLSGYGTYYPEVSLTSGWLTGVYAETAAPVGAYVLQNGAEGVGFYAVAEGSQPTMGAYRAYLNVAEASGIRGFIFDEGNATGIEAVAADGKLVDVYTVSGTLVRSQVAASKALRGLAKGIYVVGGEKKVVK